MTLRRTFKRCQYRLALLGSCAVGALIVSVVGNGAR